MQKYTKFKAGRIVNTFDCDKQTKPLDGNQRERGREKREGGERRVGDRNLGPRGVKYNLAYIHTYIHIFTQNIEHF